MKNKKVLIVGGGLAGLTAAAFLIKEGISVQLIEKEDQLGGLVNSFEREAYIFDGGLRAVESSGLIISALQDLGIDLELIKSTVSLGVGDHIIPLRQVEDIKEFELLLKQLFPEEIEAIDAIILDIRKVMSYMMVLLGNEAPVYSKGEEKPKVSFWKTVLPWLIKLIATMPKLAKLKLPVEEHLKKITQNQALIDVIIQHFFKGTPSSFALSYFLFYFDYNYPKGGTGSLTKAFVDYLKERSCQIHTGTKICALDPEMKIVRDDKGVEYAYDKLIWTADNKYLYSIIDTSLIQNKKLKKRIEKQQVLLKDLRGAESVFTVYLGVHLEPAYFRGICTEHLFYTPDPRGLSVAKPEETKTWLKGRKPNTKEEDKKYIKEYLKKYFEFNTFEISFPVLRDPDLAPEGKTGLIVSCLFDYDLCKYIYDCGWYEEFKQLGENLTIEILDTHLFKGFKKSVELCFSASPLTLEKYTGNTDGAIVGWSFTNAYMPVPQSMISMPKAVETLMPHVFQAGQWTYSPAGLPISLLTGKVAAGRVKKSR
jgi:phytoene dehydrogenase-like protein